MTADGELAGDTAALSIVESTGGAFNAPSNVQRANVGTMTIAFTSCDAGSVTFNLPAENRSGTFAIRRLRSVFSGEGSCAR